MNLYYWKPAGGYNLGDWLTVPLLHSMGVKVTTFDPNKPALFAAGTILHPTHYQRSRWEKIVVWGSAGIVPSSRLDIRAVRGPVTCHWLKLSLATPQGDPAFLFPSLVRLPEAAVKEEILYINHIKYKNDFLLSGCDTSLSMKMEQEGDGLPLIARIAASRFVASESLHGCILACAYGVPWSPASMNWREELGVGSKWQDLFAFLGLPPLSHFPATLDSARLWWETIGRFARVPSLKPLLDSLPQSL